MNPTIPETVDSCRSNVFRESEIWQKRIAEMKKGGC